MIAKPSVSWALHLAWPFIRRSTQRIFAEDRMAVEAEQRAWDEQGCDRNHEVFPLVLDVRDVLVSNGVAIQPGRSCAEPSQQSCVAEPEQSLNRRTADFDPAGQRPAGTSG